jgi:hypothetical protein
MISKSMKSTQSFRVDILEVLAVYTRRCGCESPQVKLKRYVSRDQVAATVQELARDKIALERYLLVVVDRGTEAHAEGSV